jgi:hypothetical protein
MTARSLGTLCALTLVIACQRFPGGARPSSGSSGGGNGGDLQAAGGDGGHENTPACPAPVRTSSPSCRPPVFRAYAPLASEEPPQVVMPHDASGCPEVFTFRLLEAVLGTFGCGQDRYERIPSPAVPFGVLLSPERRDVLFADPDFNCGVAGSPPWYFPNDVGEVLRAGDLDGDGRDDVVALVRRGWEIWLNQGDGTLREGDRVADASVRGWATVADLTGDGTPELAIAGEELAIFSLSAPDPQPQMIPITANKVQAGTAVPRRGYALDLEGKVWTFEAASGTSPSLAMDSGTSGSAEMAVGDLSGDGRDDIALATQGRVRTFLRDDNGKFVEGTPILAEVSTLSLQIHDIDHDGLQDLVAGGYHPGTGFYDDGWAQIFFQETCEARLGIRARECRELDALSIDKALDLHPSYAEAGIWEPPPGCGTLAPPRFRFPSSAARLVVEEPGCYEITARFPDAWPHMQSPSTVMYLLSDCGESPEYLGCSDRGSRDGSPTLVATLPAGEFVLVLDVQGYGTEDAQENLFPPLAVSVRRIR